MLLVDIFASDRADLPSGGCSAIGVLLQFTAVAQFIWIATMVHIMIATPISILMVIVVTGRSSLAEFHWLH